MTAGFEIGFIGLGTIGRPMALRVLESHPRLQVFDISVDAVNSLIERGATAAESAKAVATQCRTVFLSLPGPEQIEEVVLGASGLLANSGSLETIVDLSTNSLSLNREIAEKAALQNIHYLDAPVSGGKIAAEKGSLAVMVGGDQGAFETVESLIRCFGEHVSYMGEAGAGTLTKLVNNQIFLSASVLVQEGFVMGAKAGMDPSSLLEVLKVSSAGPIVERASLILSRKFDLGVFDLSIAAKDIAVALQSGQALGAELPLTGAANDVYQRALNAGLGKQDFFATVKVLEQTADVELPPLKRNKDREK